MNKDNIHAKCKQMYQMSLKNLQGGTPDLADEVIVALWSALSKQIKKTDQMRKEFQEYTTNEQQKRLTDYYHQASILETNLAQVTAECSELQDRLDRLGK